MRPRRRLLLKLGLFVLAGAIVNVAVAWGCVLGRFEHHRIAMAESHLMAVIRTLGKTGRVTVEQTPQGGVVISRQTLDVVERATERKNAIGFSHAVTVERDGGSTYIVSAGWPGLSLTGTWNSTASWGRLKCGDLLLHMRNPIWPGFVINTAFYALVLWLLFAAPGRVRRWRRIRRGLCPACAYPVGTSPTCTECGAPVGGFR